MLATTDCRGRIKQSSCHFHDSTSKHVQAACPCTTLAHPMCAPTLPRDCRCPSNMWSCNALALPLPAPSNRRSFTTGDHPMCAPALPRPLYAPLHCQDHQRCTQPQCTGTRSKVAARKHTHVCIQLHMSACVLECMHTLAHTYTHTHTHQHTRTRTHTHVWSWHMLAACLRGVRGPRRVPHLD